MTVTQKMKVNVTKSIIVHHTNNPAGLFEISDMYSLCIYSFRWTLRYIDKEQDAGNKAFPVNLAFRHIEALLTRYTCS